MDFCTGGWTFAPYCNVVLLVCFMPFIHIVLVSFDLLNFIFPITLCCLLAIPFISFLCCLLLFFFVCVLFWEQFPAVCAFSPFFLVGWLSGCVPKSGLWCLTEKKN